MTITEASHTTRNLFSNISQEQYAKMAKKARRHARREFGFGIQVEHVLQKPTLFGGVREIEVKNPRALSDDQWKGVSVVTTLRDRKDRVVGRAGSFADAGHVAGYTLKSKSSAPGAPSLAARRMFEPEEDVPAVLPFFSAKSSEEPAGLSDHFEDRSLSRLLGVVMESVQPANKNEVPSVFTPATDDAVDTVTAVTGAASTFAESFDDPENAGDVLAQLRSFMPPFFNDKAANDDGGFSGATGRGAVGWGHSVVTSAHEGMGTRRDVLLNRLLADEDLREAVMAALAENAGRNESRQSFGLDLAA